MKELLHEYGFLIIAIVVIVGLIAIVTVAKGKVKSSANDTVDTLSGMSNTIVNNAKSDVTANIGN